MRGGQCAAALGLFGESVPLYRAAIALGFPNLQGELAKAEQMRDDVRKAAELLEQENGRLRKAVADLTLEKLVLKEAASGNW